MDAGSLTKYGFAAQGRLHHISGTSICFEGQCEFQRLLITGAGKTTLLDVLAGRRRGLGVQGQLTLNGHIVDGQRTRDTVG